MPDNIPCHDSLFFLLKGGPYALISLPLIPYLLRPLIKCLPSTVGY